MTIAPIVQTVEVKAPPARAFELFAAHIGEWWPKTMKVGQAPMATVVIEPHAGGRWYERGEDGVEAPWGKVLAWEPPGRLLLAWQLTPEWTHDPALITEVELSFVAIEAGGTRVTLEHRQLERFGPLAEAHVSNLRNGWPRPVGQYVDFVETHL